MLSAETAILLKLQSIGSLLLILRRGIISSLTFAACQMNNVPHRLKPVPGPLQTGLVSLLFNHLKGSPTAFNQLTLKYGAHDRD